MRFQEGYERLLEEDLQLVSWVFGPRGHFSEPWNANAADLVPAPGSEQQSRYNIGAWNRSRVAGATIV